MGMTTRQKAALETLEKYGEGSTMSMDGRTLRSLLVNGWVDQPDPTCTRLLLTQFGLVALRSTRPGCVCNEIDPDDVPCIVCEARLVIDRDQEDATAGVIAIGIADVYVTAITRIESGAGRALSGGRR